MGLAIALMLLGGEMAPTEKGDGAEASTSFLSADELDVAALVFPVEAGFASFVDAETPATEIDPVKAKGSNIASYEPHKLPITRVLTVLTISCYEIQSTTLHHLFLRSSGRTFSPMVPMN
jgi:hypothetical protein